MKYKLTKENWLNIGKQANWLDKLKPQLIDREPEPEDEIKRLGDSLAIKSGIGEILLGFTYTSLDDIQIHDILINDKPVNVTLSDKANLHEFYINKIKEYLIKHNV